MTDYAAIVVHVGPLALIPAVYFARKRRSSRRAEQVLAAASKAGLTEPQSLHPVIDPTTCPGCGARASACPEGDIIGMIGGKAVMIEPAHCIGHGTLRLPVPPARSRLCSAPSGAASIFRLSARTLKQTSPASSSPANSAAWD